MIRFGIKDSRDYEFSESVIGIAIFSICTCFATLLIFSATNDINALIIGFIIYQLLNIIKAFCKLTSKFYSNTKFFIIDCIPIIGVSMRIIEILYNIYLQIIKAFKRTKQAFIETNNEEMEYRLNNIAKTNESITKKIEEVQKDIKQVDSKATRRIVRDMERTVRILNSSF
ncbi:MAG: hypothetical protein GY853_09730 [PVC group bacterium]|nr:hypothetical protein [PVC group bacterium]